MIIIFEGLIFFFKDDVWDIDVIIKFVVYLCGYWLMIDDECVEMEILVDDWIYVNICWWVY